jgi:hypothetical protein
VAIKVERVPEGWVVVENGVLTMSPDVDAAVFKALVLAEVHGTSLELGSDVPEEALTRARRLKQGFAARRLQQRKV